MAIEKVTYKARLINDEGKLEAIYTPVDTSFTSLKDIKNYIERPIPNKPIFAVYIYLNDTWLALFNLENKISNEGDYFELTSPILLNIGLLNSDNCHILQKELENFNLKSNKKIIYTFTSQERKINIDSIQDAYRYSCYLSYLEFFPSLKILENFIRETFNQFSSGTNFSNQLEIYHKILINRFSECFEKATMHNIDKTEQRTFITNIMNEIDEAIKELNKKTDYPHQFTANLNSNFSSYSSLSKEFESVKKLLHEFYEDSSNYMTPDFK